MSRAIETSKRPVWIALAVALVLHTGLISFQAGRRIDTSFIRVWILDSLAPVEKLVDRTLYSMAHLWDNYFALVGLHQENERLAAQVDDLWMQLEKQHEDILEAQRLRKLLSLQESGIGKSVVARVIGRDPARTNQTVTIDKGMTHGIKPDSAVMTPRGIVGRVIHSSNFFSIVQLILDSQSGIGVLHQSTRRQGIVKGTGGQDLELDYIEDDADLKEGDTFITSGLDRIYPKGLLVGAISSIGPRRGLFKTIHVRPAADLGRLEEVICILDHPDAVDVIDPTQETPVP
ncbi:MAG: rod shape-determining protein MreC [Acidobacteria bacterium]|nr:MAG: rod shape-determining protein MreC [Acidobacteriota bacterium]